MPLPRRLTDLQHSPGPAFSHKLGQQCVRLAQHAVDQASNPNTNKAIHQLRLTIKALRAILRLADAGRPGTDLKRIDTQLKSLSLRIAPTRDAAVLSHTVRRVARKLDRTARDTAEELATRWVKACPPPSDRVTAATRVAAAARRIASLTTTRFHPTGIAESLQRSLDRTIRRRAEARDEGSMESFHAWRRWQKRLESQLRLVSGPADGRLQRRLRDLHLLQERLGNLHDTDLLALQLASHRGTHGLPKPELRALLDKVKTRQERLRTKALNASKRILDDSFRKLVRKLARDWDRAQPAEASPRSRPQPKTVRR